MQRQEQIEKENEIEEEDDEVDMKEFVKDIRDMRQRLNYASYKVQEQDQRLVGVNDKLDDYNKEVKRGDEYMNVIQKGVFGSFKDKIKGIFKKKDKKEKEDKKDNEVIEKARNKQKEDNFDYYIEKDKDWNVIYKGEKDIDKMKDEDEILDEALNEVNGMRNAVKQFTSNVKDSTEVVDVVNKNMDKSLKNVNKVNDRMKKHK